MARTHWEGAEAAKRDVRQLLGRIAHGVRRCMYYEDSLGTDIDHHQPIKEAPLRAFDWINHLLACSHCNNNLKRDAYPCDADGRCLLVDPSAEDPAAHLTLLLASGEYQDRSPKGEETIRVFGLNRSDLVQGRQAAFASARASLRDWHCSRKEGDLDEAAQTAQALRVSPFAGAVRAMQQLAPVVAVTVLGPSAAAAVRNGAPSTDDTPCGLRMPLAGPGRRWPGSGAAGPRRHAGRAAPVPHGERRRGRALGPAPAEGRRAPGSGAVHAVSGRASASGGYQGTIRSRRSRVWRAAVRVAVVGAKAAARARPDQTTRRGPLGLRLRGSSRLRTGRRPTPRARGRVRRCAGGCGSWPARARS